MLTEETKHALYLKYGEKDYNTVLKFIDFLNECGVNVETEVQKEHFHYFVEHYLIKENITDDFDNIIFNAYMMNALHYGLKQNIKKTEKPTICKL